MTRIIQEKGEEKRMAAVNQAMSKRLKELCQTKNISYAELAEKAGVPKNKIVRMAMGAPTGIGLVLMMKICEALEVSLDEFVDTDEFKEVRQQAEWH